MADPKPMGSAHAQCQPGRVWEGRGPLSPPATGATVNQGRPRCLGWQEHATRTCVALLARATPVCAAAGCRVVRLLSASCPAPTLCHLAGQAHMAVLKHRPTLCLCLLVPCRRLSWQHIPDPRPRAAPYPSRTWGCLCAGCPPSPPGPVPTAEPDRGRQGAL